MSGFFRSFIYLVGIFATLALTGCGMSTAATPGGSSTQSFSSVGATIPLASPTVAPTATPPVTVATPAPIAATPAPTATPVPAPASTPLPASNTQPTSAAFASWINLLSAQASSPVNFQTGDSLTTWTAPDGRAANVIVKSPHPSNALSITVGSVPAGADARPYFDTAIAALKAQGASQLIIPSGTYYFNTLEVGSNALLEFANLNDVTIVGNGATLVFSQNQVGLKFRICNRVKVSNLNLEYSMHLYSIGTIQASGAAHTLVINASYPVTASDAIYGYAQYDSSKAAPWVSNGYTRLIPPGSSLAPVYAGNQTYTGSAFASIPVGTPVMVYHYYYGLPAVLISDGNTVASQSSDIWFDHFNIHSGPGMGLVVQGLARGLAFTNSSVAPKTGSIISTLFDGLHLLAVGGDVLISGSTFAGEGDDAMNLSADNQKITAINTTNLAVDLSNYSNYVIQGATLSFFDATANYLGQATVTAPPVLQSNGSYRATLNALPAGVTTSSIVRNMLYTDGRFAVINNNFSSNKAHAIVTQVPNGLIKGNTISNLKEGAIHLAQSESWVEGMGSVNILVQGNQISNTGVDLFPGAISVYGEGAQGAVLPGQVHGFIQLDGNTINGASQACISIANSFNVTVSNNVCASTNAAAVGTASIKVIESDVVTLSGNSRSGASTGTVSVDSASTGVKLQAGY